MKNKKILILTALFLIGTFLVACDSKDKNRYSYYDDYYYNDGYYDYNSGYYKDGYYDYNRGYYNDRHYDRNYDNRYYDKRLDNRYAHSSHTNRRTYDRGLHKRGRIFVKGEATNYNVSLRLTLEGDSYRISAHGVLEVFGNFSGCALPPGRYNLKTIGHGYVDSVGSVQGLILETSRGFRDLIFLSNLQLTGSPLTEDRYRAGFYTKLSFGSTSGCSLLLTSPNEF